ncbi:putative YcaC-related amidohydrolase [Desulfamplus magnetovallimortis]|uniref:Putative YcaC-related amidohydrolase n=1 Tax=Desulfamplus magnetovallimortis TaxID=1246637 RepID=A0A1W1HE81_9BACT|nr:hydrolase [Desulfamplus magnetovallimortis]SLM30743.1 putative YcaC-related amidohydrolase [Desulfamplus magnetovallimortis]
MFTKENTVLILIDIQGKLAQLMYKKDDLFNALQTLIRGMKILDIPVLWVEQIPDKLGNTIPEVADLMKELMPEVSPIAKKTFSCCANEEFMKKFKDVNRKQVLVAGIETHICLYQTAVDLLGAGFEVQVVADCVSSRTKGNKKLGIKRIVQAGGAATSTEMIIFELMKAAEGDAFRQMVKVIK